MKKISKFLKFFLIFIFPHLSYFNWKKYDSGKAYKDYLVTLDTSSDDFIDKPSNIFLHNYINDLDYQSCLEVGSGVGNRIISLAIENPSKKYSGIDINAFAIRLGTEYCLVNNIKNLKLIEANLLEIDPKEFIHEVVMSWATLIYISPREINKAIRNLALLSKGYIVLVEKVVEDNESFYGKLRIQLKGFPNFSYKYDKLLKKNGFELIQKAIVPMDIWQPGGGGAQVLIFRKV